MIAAERHVLRTLLCALALAITAATPAEAFWSTVGGGSGSAGTSTIGTTQAPGVALSGGNQVTLTWPQTPAAGSTVGALGGAYELRRYPAAGGAPVTPPSGSCSSMISGTTATLTCVETATPVGQWRYRVRPVLQSWTGADSAGSSSITVAPSGPLLDDPGRYLRGTVTLSGSSGTLPAALQTISVQARAIGGGGAWTTLCTSSTSPISCSYATATLGDGNYDLRTKVVDQLGGTTYSALRTPVTVDNTPPDNPQFAPWPAANLSANVTLSGTGHDAGSGLASIRFEARAMGGGAWTTACQTPASPLSCSWSTGSLTDGLYELRMTLIDAAGNSFTQPWAGPQNRRIDNVAPVATMAALPGWVRGGFNVTAAATDVGSGMQSVTFQFRAGTSGAWSDVCTSTGAGPAYSCWTDTSGVPDGAYQLRALARDQAGGTGPSNTISTIVDNTAPLATDVQLTNGAGTPGTPDNGDAITFSWSEPIDPASILTGWTGSATPAQVRITGCRNQAATLTIRSASGATLPLGTVSTAGYYVEGNYIDLGFFGWCSSARTLTFPASMAVSGNGVVVTLTGSQSGTRVDGAARTASWQTAWGPRDLAGNNAATAAVSEGGPADVGF